MRSRESEAVAEAMKSRSLSGSDRDNCDASPLRISKLEMYDFHKSDWRIDYGEELDLLTLKKIFSPPTRFRVSDYRWPPHCEVGRSMRAGKCFVFSGTCKFIFTNSELTLDSGEWAELPTGQHTMVNVSDCEAETVFVLEIPNLGV